MEKKYSIFTDVHKWAQVSTKNKSKPNQALQLLLKLNDIDFFKGNANFLIVHARKIRLQ